MVLCVVAAGADAKIPVPNRFVPVKIALSESKKSMLPDMLEVYYSTTTYSSSQKKKKKKKNACADVEHAFILNCVQRRFRQLTLFLCMCLVFSDNSYSRKVICPMVIFLTLDLPPLH